MNINAKTHVILFIFPIHEILNKIWPISPLIDKIEINKKNEKITIKPTLTHYATSVITGVAELN